MSLVPNVSIRKPELVQACESGVHHDAATLHVANWHAIESKLAAYDSNTPHTARGGGGAAAAAAADTAGGNGTAQSSGAAVMRGQQLCVMAAPKAGEPITRGFTGLYSANLQAALLPPDPFVGATSA